MPGLVSYASADWEIHLPLDWTGKGDTGAGEQYFESGDGTKGIYIGSWRIPPVEGRTTQQWVESFRNAEQASLLALGTYAWELLVDETVCLGTTAMAWADAWARPQSYRIASKVLLRVPLVVRAAFHDYLCDDLAASQSYFAPLIESLRTPGTPH